MIIFLLLIIAAIVLGILGLVLKGLFWLLIIGAVILVADLVYAGTRLGKGRRRTVR